ncbi:sensor histidine kinase [Kitasatospora arboriphila]
MVDVVRAAVGEVEDYARVIVRPFPGTGLLGSAVADVTHLVAELIENATVFSPPHAQVTVQGEVVAHGFCLEIDDRGLGLSEHALEEINQRLAVEQEFDLADTDRLGLFVVSRLARRHGIRVHLRPSPYGGSTAVVLVPRELLADANEVMADQFSGRPAAEPPARPPSPPGPGRAPRRTPAAAAAAAGRAAPRGSTAARSPRTPNPPPPPADCPADAPAARRSSRTRRRPAPAATAARRAPPRSRPTPRRPRPPPPRPPRRPRRPPRRSPAGCCPSASGRPASPPSCGRRANSRPPNPSASARRRRPGPPSPPSSAATPAAAATACSPPR